MLSENLLRAKSLKEQVDSYRPLDSEAELRIMQKFRLEWNFHSNNLEGNSLTFGETKALILFGITAQGKPLKDHFEISGHDEAIKWVEDIVKEDAPLTEKFIRELHILLLKKPYEVDAITVDGNPTKKRIQIGEYKTIPNHVRTLTGEIFYFATPEETPAKMGDLLKWYEEKKNSSDLNPIILSAEFHYRFVRIHPFDDGNGRVGRILMNFILMQYGYPPVIIRTQDKQSYYSALQQADTGNIEAFVDYFCLNLNSSLELMLRGAQGETIDEPDDIDKEISLLEAELNSSPHKIEIFKSPEAIQKVYSEYIELLADNFFDSSSKMGKFYFEVHEYLFHFTNNTLTKINSEKYKINVRKTSQHIDEYILLKVEFERFKIKGFEDEAFESYIKITFLPSTYTIEISDIMNDKIDQWEKLYHHRISKEEIIIICNKIIRSHIKHIKEVQKTIG